MSDSKNITNISLDATNVSWVDLASSGNTTYITSDSTANISLIDPNQIAQGTNMWGANTTPVSNVTYYSNAPDSNSGIPGEIFSEPSGNMWVKSSQGWKMITPHDLGGMDPSQPTVVEKGEKRKLKCF
jgi:hypothetical protein